MLNISRTWSGGCDQLIDGSSSFIVNPVAKVALRQRGVTWDGATVSRRTIRVGILFCFVVLLISTTLLLIDEAI
jgi:hypothetical protein